MHIGLERLIRNGPGLVGLRQGARIGLLAHPASIDADARHIVERIQASADFRIERLFAPEHGMWGHEQDMEHVRSSREPTTGLPVISLYGDEAASLRPSVDDLAGLDAVICDLQDVGARYYTYVYTVSFMMESAREAGIPIVVLDRPNPLGGRVTEGPVLEPALRSFVGAYSIPVRHGMTIGELSRLFNDAFGIGSDLRIVTMEGWSRGMRFERTGLPWVPPSPNMPSVATATVYPGGCLVEGTNVSEGRGTTTPFELVGAPWVDAARLATAMRDAELPGVVFRPTSFRPMFQKHAGSACGGVQTIVTCRDSFRPFATYLVLLQTLRGQAPESFAWRTEAYEFETERLAIDLLLGRASLREMLEAGAPLVEMERSWAAEAEEFESLRRDALLYRDD